MTGKLAAVTGATGFLGRRLVPALMARGLRVRALTRSPPPPGAWGEHAPDLIPGDLSDEIALLALCQGADIVIHGAGLIKARTRAAFFEANEGGSRRVALAAGAARMLLVSSLAAREPRLSDYAASKRAGEDAARQVLGARLTVARPPAIYGPGDRETLGLFRLAARSPVLPLPGPDSVRLALAHVDDVIAALIALIEDADPPAAAAVGGAKPEGYGWREIFGAAAAAVGAKPRLVAAPAWLVTGAGGFSEAIGAFSREAPIFTRGKAREILHADWSVSPAEQAPGAPAARFDLKAGFDDAVAWYRGAGWLP
jgi:nucleoside-diphosphate-sugar epimerase